MSSRFLVLALLAAAAYGCDVGMDGGGERDPSEVLGEDRDAWMSAGAEAALALQVGRHEAACGALERRIALYPALEGVPAEDFLVRSRSVDFYNLACARALAGRTQAALDALESSMGGDLPAVSADHLAADPDLDSLRGEARYLALLREIGWNQDVAVFEPVGPRPADCPAPPWPLRVEIDAGDPVAERDAHFAEVDARYVVAYPRAPYRVGGGAWAWMTRTDRGHQAARKCALAVEVAKRGRILDQDRVVLVGQGDLACSLAWRIVVEDPGPFRHLVVQGAAPPSWEVLDRLGKMKESGVRVWAVGEGSVPAGVDLDVEWVVSVDEALRRIAL